MDAAEQTPGETEGRPKGSGGKGRGNNCLQLSGRGLVVNLLDSGFWSRGLVESIPVPGMVCF